MAKNNKIIFIALTALLILAGVFYGMSFVGKKTPEQKSITAYAASMVEKCKDAPYRPTCYEEEVPKLVSDMPTAKIFDVIRQIRVDDPEYLYCHVLAHELGKYEVDLDPQNWLDVIATGPTDGMCSNGYAHGALVSRFSDEDLSQEEYEYALKDIAIACEEREGWNPTDLTKAICYHGIGHVLIHMTLANVDDSIHGCDTVGLKEDGRDYRQLCVEGVYMQLFQPLEPEDYALVDMLPYVPTRENLEQFCTEFSKTDEQYGACWRESWPLFGNDIYTAEGMMNYCSPLTAEQDQEKCFISAFTINGRHNLGDPDKMAANCNGVALEHQGDCFARGANAFPEEDPAFIGRAIDMCGRATAPKAQDECYGFLARVASFNFHPESPAFAELCSSLPEKWRESCGVQ